MALEDFEKELAQQKEQDSRKKSGGDPAEDKKHHHHRHHHRDRDEHHNRRKRREHSADGDEREHRRRKHRHHVSTRESAMIEDENGELGEEKTQVDLATFKPVRASNVTRDSWMEAPSSLDIDYTQKGYKKPPEPAVQTSFKKDFQLKIHDKELNKHHLQDLADGNDMPEHMAEEPTTHDVNYRFGDSGSQWRMKKLKRVYERAEEERRNLEDVAAEQFGDLASFDDAREEQMELDRRVTYGSGYVGKDKPSGDLFAERKQDLGTRIDHQTADIDDDGAEDELDKVLSTSPAPTTTAPMDQTTLNRLKAKMMKAKIRGGPEAEKLQAEYDAAMASFANTKQPDILILSTMENRMLAGGRAGEVKAIDNKRGRERGLVEENEDMSIADMVREERRNRTAAGGDSKRFAERIAKDQKFDNTEDYMDENAAKLAKRVQKSEMNLKNTAVSDFQKMNRILDTCPLCHHEDTNQPPLAPVVSLATRVYLTLPTQPELSDGGSSIVPIQHRTNLLECDDDEWEELRNFMKSLTRMYHDQGRSVLFYENAAAPNKRRHAAMEVVPLPYSLGEIAPQFFKEAILASDEEWTQHKKIIDTLAKSKQPGFGKMAFRKTLVKEMPYFHVWFEIDGGLGHIVEDSNRWPKGDLFAREIIGGMLDLGPEVVKRQGKWTKGDPRVEPFRKRWRKFDWTRVLTDG